MTDNTTSTFDFQALIEGVKCTHKVRVTTIEGNPWFVVVDVARALNIYIRPDGEVQTNRLCSTLDGDQKATQRISGPGGTQKMVLVSESGLYKLIMRSDKPQAKPFQDWVTREVLPSIRKTGGYQFGAGETMPLPTSFASALWQHAETLIKLAEEQEEHARTKAEQSWWAYSRERQSDKRPINVVTRLGLIESFLSLDG